MIKLKRPPNVREISYINDYLMGVKTGLDEEELQDHLTESKRRFEIEKWEALGTGKPSKKDISRTKDLTKDCFRVTDNLGFIKDNKLTEQAEKYLQSDPTNQKILFCEKYSEAYPHFGLILSLLETYDTLVFPTRNDPPFRPFAHLYGIDTHQSAFDIPRDLASIIGLINYYKTGKGEAQRQFVYKTCHQVTENAFYKIHYNEGVRNYNPNKVESNVFRETLWENYMDQVNGVSGAPIYYCQLRDTVCFEHRISDHIFDNMLEVLIETDDKYNIIWSQGYLHELAKSSRKDLPPKNIDGKYMVFLKIMRY